MTKPGIVARRSERCRAIFERARVCTRDRRVAVATTGVRRAVHAHAHGHARKGTPNAHRVTEASFELNSFRRDKMCHFNLCAILFALVKGPASTKCRVLALRQTGRYKFHVRFDRYRTDYFFLFFFPPLTN